MTEKKDWIARYVERTTEERAALRAAAEKHYAHLMNKPRDWIADLRRNRAGAGQSRPTAQMRL